MGRYERNFPAISNSEQVKLAQKSVLVAGCGGLGGYIIEILGRAGVGRITAADGDVFADSNLNRQLLSDTLNLGHSKAVCAAKRMSTINPGCEITPFRGFITDENVGDTVRGHDLVIDALDNGHTRVILAAAAGRHGIFLVSGAISGWRGRVFVLRPGEDASFLWEGDAGYPAGNLACTAACVASVQAAEAIKLLLSRDSVLTGRFLEIDLGCASWELIPVNFEKK